MSEAKFADSESDDEYQSLSVLAMLALFASLASPLALLTPLLWFFPIIPIVLGLFAIGAISRRPDSLTGSRLAIIAIVIGAFFLALAPARAAARRIWLGAEAQQHADAWLDLVIAGKIAESYNLTLSSDMRATNLETINTRYGRREDGGEFPESVDELFSTEPLSLFVGDEKAKLEFISFGVYQYIPRSKSEEFTLHYEVVKSSKRLPISVIMRRDVLEEAPKPIWTVAAVRDDSDEH